MRFASSTSIVALAAAMTTASGTMAQQVIPVPSALPDTTPSNVNVLNLLSPYFNLIATPTGQTTLKANLDNSVAVNAAATPAQQAMAISDKKLLGSASGDTITLADGTKVHVGIADNLAGGLPLQAIQTSGDPASPTYGRPGTINPVQPVGGYGIVLGPLYQTGARASTATTGPLAATVNLLSQAYSFTGADLGVAKNYFANGAATNAATAPYYSLTAVAPAGYTLPTANGLPNTTNSVYDQAYGVNNTQQGQNVYGSSRPVQAALNRYNIFDPAALDNITTNPSFPSGHTTYAYTDSILLGMLVPQLYQSMLVRASEYANSRIELGVHYALDIIASRALVTYDLAQAFTNAQYINNAATTGQAYVAPRGAPPAGTGVGQAINLPALFVAAQANLQSYLQANLPANCGGTVAACATSAANTTNNPYVPSAANQALYQQRLTYGLPTLTFDQAPREAAPAGGPSASILLAPLYGGSTTAAQTIAPGGGIYGNLQSSTIDQIVINTEGVALAAFYGTPLSYWSRIDLYSAAGYFQNVSGTLTMSPSDQLTTPVTIGSTGILYGNGATITGNVTALSGATFGGGSATGAATTTVNGNLALQPGSTYAVTVTAANTASNTKVNGTATVSGSRVHAVSTLPSAYALVGAKLPVLTATSVSGTFQAVSLTGTMSNAVVPTLTYTPTGVTLNVRANTITSQLRGGASQNQLAVGGSINAILATGKAPPAFVRLFTLPSASLSRALSQLSGEVAATQATTTILAGSNFLGTLIDPNIQGRGAAVAGTTPFLASVPEANQYTGQVRYSKDGPAPIAAARPAWSVWATGTGLNADLAGDRSTGSRDVSIQLGGIAVGADYRAAPGTVMGFGVGGASTWVKLDGGLGSATSNIFQVGGYASQRIYGPGYVSGAFAYSNADGRTSRIAAVSGTSATLTGRPDTDLFGGRLEAGFRYGGFGFVGLTPYAAVEVQNANTGAYAERSTGSSVFAIRYQDKDNTNVRIEGGARFDVATTGFGAVFGRLAYVHQDLTPAATGLFEGGLSATAFTIRGAKLPTDAALVALGSDVRLAPNLKLTGQAIGELAPKASTVAGRLTLRYEF